MTNNPLQVGIVETTIICVAAQAVHAVPSVVLSQTTKGYRQVWSTICLLCNLHVRVWLLVFTATHAQQPSA